jgi:hypothetical protein
MRQQKFTYTELMQTKVINPTFEPTVEQYAKALIFAEDYYEGKRNYIVTSKPYLWALALQKTERTVVISGITRFEELSLEKSQEILRKAKEIRQKKIKYEKEKS